MSAPTDDAIAGLVRRTLPRHSEMEWQVDWVDQIEEAGADVRPGEAVVRAHRVWFTRIYGDQLSHVARHYPLALEPITFRELSVVVQSRIARWCDRVNLWRAVAIEREFVRGLFTGRLRVDHPGHFTYIARTHDRRGVSAHWDILVAAREALKERRRTLKAEREDDKRLAEFRAQISGRLQARLVQGRFRHVEVSLDQLCQRLSPDAAFVLRSGVLHATRTVPLVELERSAIDAVRSLSARDIRSLIGQLDVAIDEAQLTLQDEVSLLHLGCRG
jgi:hypothetical protein